MQCTCHPAGWRSSASWDPAGSLSSASGCQRAARFFAASTQASWVPASVYGRKVLRAASCALVSGWWVPAEPTSSLACALLACLPSRGTQTQVQLPPARPPAAAAAQPRLCHPNCVWQIPAGENHRVRLSGSAALLVRGECRQRAKARMVEPRRHHCCRRPVPPPPPLPLPPREGGGTTSQPCFLPHPRRCQAPCGAAPATTAASWRARGCN